MNLNKRDAQKLNSRVCAALPKARSSILKIGTFTGPCRTSRVDQSSVRQFEQSISWLWCVR